MTQKQQPIVNLSKNDQKLFDRIISIFENRFTKDPQTKAGLMGVIIENYSNSKFSATVYSTQRENALFPYHVDLKDISSNKGIVISRHPHADTKQTIHSTHIQPY